MKKWLDKYQSKGEVKNSLNRTVTCSNCGWSWKLSDGGADPLTCHKCGGTIKMKHGGELDEYQTKGEVKSTFNPYQQNKPIIDRGNFSQDYAKPVAQNIWINPNTGLPMTKDEVVMATAQQIAQNQNSGSIRKKVPFSAGRRVLDIVSNPMTAAQQAIAKQPITGRGPRNILDNAVDLVNPITYAKAIKNTTSNVVHPIETLKKLGNAGLGTLQYITEGNTNIPVGEGYGVLFDGLMTAGALKSVKPFLKTPLAKTEQFVNNLGNKYLPNEYKVKYPFKLILPKIPFRELDSEIRVNELNNVENKLKKIHDLAINENNPKYIERLKKEFGINYKDLAQPNLKINKWVKNTRYDPKTNTIEIFDRDPEKLGISPETIYEHEYGHFLQKEAERLNPKSKYNLNLKNYKENLEKYNIETKEANLYNENLDKTYENSAKTNQDYKDKVFGKKYTYEPKKPILFPLSEETSIDVKLNKLLKNINNNNFEHFNIDAEPFAYAREFRQDMLNKGILKNKWDKITYDQIDKMMHDGNSRITKVLSLSDKPTKRKLLEELNNIPALIPTVLGTTAIGAGALNQKQEGGAIITDRGQWDYPGQTTIIPSNEITMRGVSYPVTGVDNLGNTKVMQPEMNYTFPGQYVTEYPMAQNGKEVKKSSNIATRKNISGDALTSTVKREISAAYPYFKNIGTYFEKGISKISPDYKSQEDRELLFKRHRPVAYPSVSSGIGDVVKDYSNKFFNTSIQEPFKDKEGDYEASEEAWRMTLGLPVKSKYIIPSTYRPLNETNKASKYYTLNENMYDKNLLRQKVEELKLKPGQSVGLESFAPFINEKYMNRNQFSQVDPLQNFTIGVNKNGKMYFYDKYDFDFEPLSKVTRPYEYEFYNEFKTGGEMIKRADGSYSRRGMWNTIDLTQKSGATTIAQGVAATKKWHKENPYMKEYGGAYMQQYKEGGNVNYIVKKGETLSKIAKDSNIPSYTTLAKLNNIKNPDYIQTGQGLYVPNRGGVPNKVTSVIPTLLRPVQQQKQIKPFSISDLIPKTTKQQVTKQQPVKPFNISDILPKGINQKVNKQEPIKPKINTTQPINKKSIPVENNKKEIKKVDENIKTTIAPKNNNTVVNQYNITSSDANESNIYSNRSYVGKVDRVVPDRPTLNEKAEGIWDGINQRAIGSRQEEDKEAIVKKPLPKSKIKRGYKELYTVRDMKGGTKDSLLASTYTGDNDTGTVFQIGNMVANLNNRNQSFENVEGVAHFIMDGDVLPNQTHTEPYYDARGQLVSSNVPGKFINSISQDPNAYNMYYKPNNAGNYNIVYKQNKFGKLYLDKGWENDLTVRSVPYSNVDWEGKGPSTGYFTKSNYIPLKNNMGATSIPYKNKSGYSRFSGGSGIYVYKDPITNREIQTNVTGSPETLKQIGESIINENNIDPNDLTFLYHDMGSYSAKPKARPDGTLNYNQWLNYNTYNRGRSGAPIMIPKQEYGGDVPMFANGGGIPDRYRNMGFTNVGAKKQSTRPGKKWMVLAKKGDDYKVVHGGYKGMQDFKQHHSEQRKENFWSRMGGRNSSKATDPFSPLYWHKRFGTWEYGGQPMAVGGQNVMNPIVKKDNRNWLEYLKN